MESKTVPGYQKLPQKDVLYDMIFCSGIGRQKRPWVLAHLRKNDEDSHSISDVVNCPKVLFFLAVSFLFLCFRAILGRANIFLSRKSFRKKELI